MCTESTSICQGTRWATHRYYDKRRSFFVYCIFTVLMKLPGWMLIMEHHEWVSVNTPPHSEAWVCFELGLMPGTHTHNQNSPRLGFTPRILYLWAQHPIATELFQRMKGYLWKVSCWLTYVVSFHDQPALWAYRSVGWTKISNFFLHNSATNHF